LRRFEGGFVDRSDFQQFNGRSTLRAMFAALEFPGLAANFVERFRAVGKSEPTGGFTVRADQADGVCSGGGFLHVDLLSSSF